MKLTVAGILTWPCLIKTKLPKDASMVSSFACMGVDSASSGTPSFVTMSSSMTMGSVDVLYRVKLRKLLLFYSCKSNAFCMKYKN